VISQIGKASHALVRTLKTALYALSSAWAACELVSGFPTRYGASKTSFDATRILMFVHGCLPSRNGTERKVCHPVDTLFLDTHF
jgi:hypothetical protein